MPRLHFRWPRVVREATRQYVRDAFDRLDPERYEQESAYVDALVGRLDGRVYDGPYGKVEFRGTIYTERGKDSAERFSGADFGIVANLSGRGRSVEKGILTQAKRGLVTELPRRENERLRAQVDRMKEVVRAPKILQMPPGGGQQPTMVSGNKWLAGQPFTSIPLEDYFVRYVMTCIEGERDPQVVQGISESDMTTLRLLASTRDKDTANR